MKRLFPCFTTPACSLSTSSTLFTFGMFSIDLAFTVWVEEVVRLLTMVWSALITTSFRSTALERSEKSTCFVSSAPTLTFVYSML